MSGWYRLQCERPGRGDDLYRLAGQLEDLLTTLASSVPSLGAWSWQPEDGGAPQALERMGGLRHALTSGKVRWRTGQVEQESYVLRAVASERGAPRATLKVVCGIWLPEFAPWSVPERLQVRVSPSLGGEAAVRAALSSVLAASVRAWEPEWAALGDDDSPTSASPLFSQPGPSVGWWTWLGRSFPALPPLPPPSARVPTELPGVLLAAHPALYRGGDPEQERAIRALREALLAAKSLTPTRRPER